MKESTEQFKRPSPPSTDKSAEEIFREQMIISEGEDVTDEEWQELIKESTCQAVLKAMEEYASRKDHLLRSCENALNDSYLKNKALGERLNRAINVGREQYNQGVDAATNVMCKYLMNVGLASPPNVKACIDEIEKLKEQ